MSIVFVSRNGLEKNRQNSLNFKKRFGQPSPPDLHNISLLTVYDPFEYGVDEKTASCLAMGCGIPVYSG